MPISLRHAVVFALYGAACSGSKDAPAKGSLPVPALECGNILPESLRTKYFNDFVIEDKTTQPTHGACVLLSADRRHGSIYVDCPIRQPVMIQETIDDVKKRDKGARQLTIGRGGVITPGVVLTEVQVWDDDSFCSAQLLLPPGVDAEAFTRDLIAYLPPK